MRSIEILFLFFTAILAGDFKKAHGLTSKTWAEKNGPDALKEKFKGVPDGLSFEVDRIIKDLPTEQVHIVVFTSEGKTGNTKVGMIRESWPGKKDAQGDWGVDPDNTEAIGLVNVEQVGAKKPEPAKKQDPKPEAAVQPDSAPPPDYAEVLAKAEDIGIEVPEGVTAELIQELIQKELAAEVPGPAPKPAPKKPATKKPAAKKGGKK